LTKLSILWVLSLVACPTRLEEPEPPGGIPFGAPRVHGEPEPPPDPRDAQRVVQAGAGVWTQPKPQGASAAEPAALCSGCDVVIVTMCSVRRDHVDPYVDLELTPNLARIAAEGVHFDRAYSASNFTLASLTAVLTGRFGSSTGVVGWDKGLVSGVPTLPEVLGYYGYATGGFSINAASGFRPEYGLDQGFQRLEIIEAPSDNPDGRQPGGPTGSGLSAQPMAKWVRSQPAGQPIFALFHTRTAHFPFVVSKPSASEDPTGMARMLWGDEMAGEEGQMPGVAGGTATQGVGVSTDPNQLREAVQRAGPQGLAVWRQHYAASMRRMDADLGVVLQALEETGRLDKTILIVVSDHGESLGDHGELLHGDSYFDPIVRVPLMMRVPGVPADPQARSALVSQVDLLPTVLELVGAVAPAGIDGVSLLPVLQDATAQVRGTALIEGGVSWTPRDAMRGAVVSPPWILLRQPLSCVPGKVEPPPGPGEPFRCLFNLDEDPGQTRNLASEQPEVVAELQARWDGFRAARQGKTVAQKLQLDPSFKALLRKSGYFSAAEGR
jgi:arylsulfatase A-like enzyme